MLEVVKQGFRRSRFMDERGKLMFEPFAKFLVDTYHISKFEFDGYQLYHLQNGIFVPMKHDDIPDLIPQYIPNVPVNGVKQVVASVSQLATKISDAEVERNKKLISCDNGFVDYNGNFKPYEDVRLRRNMVPVTYMAEPESPDVEQLMTNICKSSKAKYKFEEDKKRMLLEEIMGACLMQEVKCSSAFILLGKGQNGKSCFTTLIKEMLGEDNCSALDLKKICADGFNSNEVIGKLANLGDDISGNYISDSSMFKKVVTGEFNSYEVKFKENVRTAPYATLVFSANELPPIKMDGGVERRLSIVKFNNHFTANNPDTDPYLMDRILEGTPEHSREENMAYLFKLALRGLQRLKADNWRPIVLQESVDEFSKYLEDCDPVLEWANEWVMNEGEFGTEGSGFVGKAVSALYKEYSQYCEDCGYKAVGQKIFTRRIGSDFDVISESRYCPDQKKNVRVFVLDD